MDNENTENTVVRKKKPRSTINRKLGDRERLSTTINADVLKEFRSRCEEDGYKLSAVLEAFMKQYNIGELTLTVVKTSSVYKSSENDTIMCPEELKLE